MDKSYTSLGLMSGTSMDGVDASIIKSDGNSEYSLILDRYFKYDNKFRKNLINLRSKILNANDLKLYFKEITELERELTIIHAKIVKEI